MKPKPHPENSRLPVLNTSFSTTGVLIQPCLGQQCFLSDFGSRDSLALMGYAQRQGTQEQGKSKPIAPLHGTIAVLEFWKSPEAEELTFAHFPSRNILLNRALGLIAAKRWPAHLIKDSFSPDDERKRLLAALCVMHPEMEPALHGLVPGEELARYKAIIDKTGIAGFLQTGFRANLVF